jgi:asparagine synthase (glutamine-hydrolysing)
MSGIVGIVHFDGAPVDRRLLAQMTGSMAFRGPDAQEVWIDRNVGFGHTLLKTTEESEHEHQPFTLDGKVWIIADARVDARRDLVPQLRAHGHESLSSYATDVELILRAYQTWGQSCVEHILGDFAFAIWDSPQQRLFCARDHLGVKPFFYTSTGKTLIFSNSLDCIRQHPAISDRLNDLAIAEFLLFDANQDPATTSFAEIQRLPPAHSATVSSDATRLYRYWTLPVDAPTYFCEDEDYVDRFTELLEQAVDDRLRTNKVSLFMSGGLDSPALATTASRNLLWRSPDSEVRAFTTVIDGFDGNERHYAALVAGHLGISIEFRDLTERSFDPDWDEIKFHTPEPVACPMNLFSDRDQHRAMARHSRVWFYGEGPDNALRHEWRFHFSDLIRRRQFGRLANALRHSVVRSRRVPFISRLSHQFLTLWDGQSQAPNFPAWLNPDFSRRLGLKQRWEEQGREWVSPVRHPHRPEAYRYIEGVPWHDLFARFDPEVTGVASDVRHPFLDLRLLRYMLAVPVIPWCREKYLVRRAMQGLLPQEVLRRPKFPLRGDNQWEGARRLGMNKLDPSLGLEAYVEVKGIPDRASQDMINFWVDFRPRALNYWLRNLRPKALAGASQRLTTPLVSGLETEPGSRTRLRLQACN